MTTTATQEHPMPTLTDALATCNACDDDPADPTSPAGYCAACEREARVQTCRGFRAASDVLPCDSCGAAYAAHGRKAGRPMTARRRDPNEGIDVNELVETTHEVEHLRELIATGYAHRYPNARPGERRWGLSAAQRLPRMLEEQRRAMEAQGVRVVDDPDELERLRARYRFHEAEDGPGAACGHGRDCGCGAPYDPDEEYDDGLILIAGVLYDAETLEEAEA